MSVPSEPLLFSYNGTIRPKCETSSVTLFWDAPASDGGNAIESYTITCTDGPDSNSPYELINSNTRVYQITGLSNLSNYTYTVAASNANGVGAAATYRTVQPGKKALPPSNVGISTLSETVARITWDGATSTEDTPAPKWYVITPASTDPADPIFSQAAKGRKSASGWQREYTYQGLNLTQTRYTFLVQAVNDPGYSPPNTYTSSLGTFFPPGALFYLPGSNYNSTTGVWVDDTANGNDFTYRNAIIPGTSEYVIFDQTGTLACSNADLTQQFSSYTTSVWLKHTPKGSYAPEYGVVGQKMQGTSLYIDHAIRLDTGVTFKGAFYDGTGPVWYQGTGFTLPAQWWRHVVITRSESGDTKTYIDGSLLGTEATGVINNTDGGEFLLGASYSPLTTSEYAGYMGDVAFWPRVLTPTEISNYYVASVSNYPQIQSGYIQDEHLLLYLNASNFGSGTWSNGAPSNVGLYDATASGTVTTTSNSLIFNGTDAYLTIPSGFGMDASTFTIQAWVYQTNFITDQDCSVLTDSYDSGGSNRFNYTLRFGAANAIGGAPNSWYSQVYDGTTNIGTNGVNYPGSNWYNLATTYDQATGTLTFYKNGNLFQTATGGGSGLWSGGDAYIGRALTVGVSIASSNLFEGEIGDILFYDRVLSIEEIGSNYAASVSRYPNSANT